MGAAALVETQSSKRKQFERHFVEIDKNGRLLNSNTIVEFRPNRPYSNRTITAAITLVDLWHATEACGGLLATFW
jgi:hypothetical protein